MPRDVRVSIVGAVTGRPCGDCDGSGQVEVSPYTDDLDDCIACGGEGLERAFIGESVETARARIDQERRDGGRV